MCQRDELGIRTQPPTHEICPPSSSFFGRDYWWIINDLCQAFLFASWSWAALSDTSRSFLPPYLKSWRGGGGSDRFMIKFSWEHLHMLTCSADISLFCLPGCTHIQLRFILCVCVRVKECAREGDVMITESNGRERNDSKTDDIILVKAVVTTFCSVITPLQLCGGKRLMILMKTGRELWEVGIETKEEDHDAMLTPLPSATGAGRPCHRHRRLPQPGCGVAGRRRGWWPCDLHQGVSVSPDLSPAHRCQHGPRRPRADGVCWEREHGEELGAAQRKVGWFEGGDLRLGYGQLVILVVGLLSCDSLKRWLKGRRTHNFLMQF